MPDEKCTVDVSAWLRSLVGRAYADGYTATIAEELECGWAREIDVVVEAICHEAGGYVDRDSLSDEISELVGAAYATGSLAARMPSKLAQMDASIESIAAQLADAVRKALAAGGD